jgi:hypothetical protein
VGEDGRSKPQSLPEKDALPVAIMSANWAPGRMPPAVLRKGAASGMDRAFVPCWHFISHCSKDMLAKKCSCRTILYVLVYTILN